MKKYIFVFLMLMTMSAHGQSKTITCKISAASFDSGGAVIPLKTFTYQTSEIGGFPDFESIGTVDNVPMAFGVYLNEDGVHYFMQLMQVNGGELDILAGATLNLTGYSELDYRSVGGHMTIFTTCESGE